MTIKSYLLRILLFSLPFLSYVIIAFYIDPYNIIREEQQLGLIQQKEGIAKKINYPLYKLVAYQKAPSEVLLLGDSRTNAISSAYIESLIHQKTFNMAYGNGTLEEIIQSFWEANLHQSPKQVYIGINFNLYNEANKRDRVSEAISLKNSLIHYLLSTYCLKSTYLILKAQLFNQNIDIEKPPFSREDFWKHQLAVSAKTFYKRFIPPNYYKKELAKIATYCTKNNIKLVFFIPPTHIDLQNKIKEFGLESEAKKFKNDLNNLAKVYDFDYPNEITFNKNNFKDPFHFNDSISKVITQQLFLE